MINFKEYLTENWGNLSVVPKQALKDLRKGEYNIGRGSEVKVIKNPTTEKINSAKKGMSDSPFMFMVLVKKSGAYGSFVKYDNQVGWDYHGGTLKLTSFRSHNIRDIITKDMIIYLISDDSESRTTKTNRRTLQSNDNLAKLTRMGARKVEKTSSFDINNFSLLFKHKSAEMVKIVNKVAGKEMFHQNTAGGFDYTFNDIDHNKKLKALMLKYVKDLPSELSSPKSIGKLGSQNIKRISIVDANRILKVLNILIKEAGKM